MDHSQPGPSGASLDPGIDAGSSAGKTADERTRQ
jgi:hypothetical protein